MLAAILNLTISFVSGASNLAASDLQYLMEIRPAYKQICGDCRFEFSDFRISTALKEGLEKASLKTGALRWGRSFLLPLEIEGKNVGWVSGQVKILKLGLRALKAIPQGQSMRAEDFRPDWIDVTLAKDQLAQVEDLQSVDSRRFMAVREPLLKGDLKKSQIVSRGQIINVVTGSDGFSVSTQMKTEEAGSLGDLIRVKNSETQKVLSVRLQSDGSGRFD